MKKTENKIVCITGLTGSGKSIASDFFIKKGFEYLRFGQITMDKLKEESLEINETNEKKMREGLRKRHGMAAFAILNLNKLKVLRKKDHVVADGLYSFAEYKILKENFGDNLLVIAIYAPPKMRYYRLVKRKFEQKDKSVRNRPLTNDEAVQRDISEIENLDKGGSIAMADYTVLNTKTIVFLNKQLNEIYKEIHH